MQLDYGKLPRFPIIFKRVSPMKKRAAKIRWENEEREARWSHALASHSMATSKTFFFPDWSDWIQVIGGV